MTTFKEIRGTDILALSSDPTNPETGQIWYNSSSGTLKGYLFATVNAWASGGSLPVAKGAIGSAGTQTAALGFAGYDNGSPGKPTATLLYDGTSWTTSPASMSTPRYWPGSANAGTQTAALAFGGYVAPTGTTATESYNGTSWTSAPSLNTGRYGAGSAGTQTAALIFAGANPGITATEKYNGTSWTTVNSMNTSRGYLSGCGLSTAALGMGGYAPGNTAATESYNGTSWTTVNSLNTARRSLGSFGTQTATIAFGGVNPSDANVTATESWNGSSWTTNPTGLATARFRTMGAGSQTAGLAIGGRTTIYVADTEEWTGQQLQTKTITVS